MKKTFIIILLLLLAALLYLLYLNYPKLNIITGFAAKNVCSCIFEAERAIESIEAGDNDFEPVSFANNKIDFEERAVSSTVIGLKKRTAVFKNGLGCILIAEETENKVAEIPRPKRNLSQSPLPYPYGNGRPVEVTYPNIDYNLLKDAVNNAFDRDGEKAKRSRAVVVLYKDHLIAEKYAPEFDKNTKLLGWSMTKSITSAVLGVMEEQGKISLNRDKLFTAWKNDARSKITLNNMLQMNSGLEWEEDYATISDVTKMLFLEENMPQVQLGKPLIGEPGNTWNYSSGTSNLLSGFIRDQFSSHQEYLNFWYSGLIDRIGMNSMTLEPDVAGNYIGSSYSWATARDWAKFGLLYLHRGNWNGDRVLRESWVEYTATPAPDSNGEYGAHFWLNAGGKYPNVPRDLFSSNGFQGQHVFIIPSKEVVIVRFGLTEHPEFDVDQFLNEVLAAIN